jgi:hypothetical protein
MLEWINIKTFWLFCPYFVDAFIGRKPLQKLKPLYEVIVHQEVVICVFSWLWEI